MNKDNKFFIGIVLLLLASMIAIGVIVFRDKREEQSKQYDKISLWQIIFLCRNKFCTKDLTTRGKYGI